MCPSYLVPRPAYGRTQDLYSACAIALTIAFTGFAGAAQAQKISGPPPPVASTIDENGVDLGQGVFTVSSVDVTIGQPGAGGLVYSRMFRKDAWRDSLVGTIKSSGAKYTVSFGGGSNTFTKSGSTYTSDQADGATLTFDSGTQVYTYTTRDGAVALLSKALAESTPLEANEGKVTSVTLPNGEKATYTYKTVTIGGVAYNRLQSVTNNLGYQLKLDYTLNTPINTGQLNDFRNIIKVTGLNNTVDYCNPAADSCSFSVGWPNATYAAPSSTTRTVTDSLGRTTLYTYDASNRITGIRRPSAASNTTIVTYSPLAAGYVASVSNGVETWNYSFTPDGVSLYSTIDAPSGQQRNITTQDGAFMVEYDGTLTQISPVYYYEFTGTGRLWQVVQLEGDYVRFAYDSRGNATTVTQVPKPGSGLTSMVTTSSFDATCSNVVTCNKPNSVTGTNGAVTNYTYDATHGGVLTVTEPAPTVGAVRPQTRFTYGSLYAWYKDSTGVVVQAPAPVTRLTATSACATTASCAGGADEVKTTVTYGASGVANNLLPTSVSSGSGDGVLTATTAMTYDTVGNPFTVDGPLPGAADTTRYRFDAGRQLVGVVGPDPDGGGALKHRGLRTTFNADGQVSAVEQVAVTSQSDPDWAAATVLNTRASTYDSRGRLVASAFSAGGTTWAVNQYSYDSVNRPECSVVRMNPAIFGSLPASACTLGTTGANGPDRITKQTWDTQNRLTKTTLAFGTAAQQDEVTATYTDNDRVATQADAMGGLTTYEYDGFDRLKKVRYPDSVVRTNSSSTDYEQYSYASGNLTVQRRRNGDSFTATYDDLRRITLVDASTGNDITHAYDNLGRETSTAFTGHTLTYVYDALSRVTSATGPLGTTAYQYDLAGRRTRMTWPDSFYVTYDYDLTNAMTAVRENGAASGVGVLATFAYDDHGRRVSLTRGNGEITSYGFDPASRLTSLAHDFPGAASDMSYALTYNAASQALTRVGTNTPFVSPSTGTTSYTSNGLNQLTAAGGASLTYSGNGNLASDGARTYGYDAANRLTSVTGATLAYDPVGRLYQTAGAATTKFGYDGVDLVGEYNSAGVLQRRYVHGPGVDEPLVWYEGSGTTDRRWLSGDTLGSVIAVSDAAGAVTATNSYDEYGLPGTGNSGRFSYTGQTWIPEAGLLNYKARMYAPGLGRFIQPDPIGFMEGMNLYAYVGGDPVNATDPSGLCSLPGESACQVAELEIIAPACPRDNICLEGSILWGNTALLHLPQGNIVGGSGGAGLGPNVASIRFAKMPEDEQEAENQKDEAICRMIGTRECWESAAVRRARRAAGQSVPPPALQTGVKESWHDRNLGNDVGAAALIGAAACVLAEPCGAAVAAALGFGGLVVVATQ
jgi:RHS repeat-associated protein